MGEAWRYRNEENMTRFIESHRKYLKQNIKSTRIYIGVTICPKCGKKGCERKLLKENMKTKTMYSPTYEIEHYVGTKGKNKKIVKYCYLGTKEGDTQTCNKKK